jgi:chorismate dehydratase
VREDFCRNDPECVREIHSELVRSISQGKKELRAISKKVAPRIPMPEDDCYSYLRGIEYDLGPKKQEALALFFQYLIKRGEAPAEALPVKYFMT